MILKSFFVRDISSNFDTYSDMQQTFDLLLCPDVIVTMDEKRQVLRDGAVGVKDGKIAYVGPRTPELGASEIIEKSNSILIPGLINTHTHVPMTMFRGLADDLPLMQWLTKHIFPAEGTFATPENIYWSSMVGIMEMLKSGTTTFCDMYFHIDRIAEAVEKTGIRAVLSNDVCMAYLQNEDPDVRFEKGLQESQALKERFAKHDLIDYALGPHAPYSIAPVHLKRAIDFATSTQTAIVTHIAETRGEKAMIEGNYGVKLNSPIQYLEEAGLFDAKVLSVHTVWTDDKDLEILAQNNVGVAHCPQSNLKLGSGVARIPDMLEKGIAVGLGTDGPASNNNQNLWEEMTLSAMVHKGVLHDPTAVNAQQAFASATIEGARAIGLQDKVGSVMEGKWADLVWLDTNAPHHVPMSTDVYSHLVYVTQASDVSDVWVAGVQKVKDKNLILDQKQASDAVSHIKSLRPKMEAHIQK